MFSDDSDVKPAACQEYEELLKKSHAALAAWTEGRAEIGRSGRKGRAIDNELRMLQANFAKAYNALQNHARDCGVCQMPTLVHSGYDASSTAYLHSLHH
jgi:hypothetical protein